MSKKRFKKVTIFDDVDDSYSSSFSMSSSLSDYSINDVPVVGPETVDYNFLQNMNICIVPYSLITSNRKEKRKRLTSHN